MEEGGIGCGDARCNTCSPNVDQETLERVCADNNMPAIEWFVDKYQCQEEVYQRAASIDNLALAQWAVRHGASAYQQALNCAACHGHLAFVKYHVETHVVSVKQAFCAAMIGLPQTMDVCKYLTTRGADPCLLLRGVNRAGPITQDEKRELLAWVMETCPISDGGALAAAREEAAREAEEKQDADTELSLKHLKDIESSLADITDTYSRGTSELAANPEVLARRA